MKITIKKRKVLKEGYESYDDEIYEVKIKIHLPKTAKDEGGTFIGLDRIKNDIRALSDITVVGTIESKIFPEAIVALLLIKINMRTIKNMSPPAYVKKVFIPTLEKFFAYKGGFGYENRPKILQISKVTDHFPTQKEPFG